MKQKKQFNHETWYTCHVCGQEYDLRLRSQCPNCKALNTNYTMIKLV